MGNNSNASDFAFHRIMDRVMNVPLAVTRDKLDTVLRVLSSKVGIAMEIDGVELQGVAVDKTKRDTHGYIVANGIAMIPVQGTLVSRVSGLKPYSGMVGYNQISAMFEKALKDDDVSGIMLDIDSPGGEVSGLFDLVDTLVAGRGKKPMIAAVNDSAYSAAYAIATAADKIILPRTGGVGSVGVIATHFDAEEAMKKEGYKATLVYAGKHKADFSPYGPLTAQALERLQERVNADYGMFCELVAHNRGMSLDAVKATEALTYHGADAIAIGFADEVRNVSAVLAEPNMSREIQVTRRNAMPWKMLNEALRLEDKGTDEANQKQIVDLVAHLTDKAQAQDRVTDFCALHGVESLDEMTARMQSLVPAADATKLQERLAEIEAERLADFYMAPEQGKIAEANQKWARDFAKRDPEGFKAVMDAAPRLIPNAASVVPKKAEEVNGEGNLAASVGMDAEDYQSLVDTYGKEKADESIRKGIEAAAKKKEG